MNTKNLSYLSIPLLTLVTTMSFAAIRGPITFGITNNTSCMLKTDPNNSNCSTQLNIASGQSGLITCNENQGFELYYAPDETMHPTSSLLFHHNISAAPKYTYFMQSYGFQTARGFDGATVKYTINPTTKGSYVMTGATSPQISDMPHASDLLSGMGNNFVIVVKAGIDTCF